MNSKFNTRIQNKIDTLANWTLTNPTLLDGEIGIVLDGDSRKLKVGDGTTTFNNLPYVAKELYDHLLDKNNPHEVNATQVMIPASGSYVLSADVGYCKAGIYNSIAPIFVYNGDGFDDFELRYGLDNPEQPGSTFVIGFNESIGKVLLGLYAPDIGGMVIGESDYGSDGQSFSFTSQSLGETHQITFVSDSQEKSVATAISDLELNKQDKLTAGENITIEDNVISAAGFDESKLDNYLPLSGGTVTGDILRQLSGDSYYHVWNNTNNSINITTQMAFIKEDVWDNLYKGSSVSPVTIKTSISTNLTDSSSYDEIPSYTWTTTDPESSSIDSPVNWHCVENPTDTIIAYYDSTRNGTWLKFGSDFILCGTAIPSSNGTVVKHEGDEDLIPYIYGPASATHLGGIKVGSNLTVDSEGVLSAVVPQGVQPSNDDPLPDAATSYAGISESYSRSDHVHPLSSYIINFELAIDSEDFTSFPLELHGENIQICDSTGTELTDITISDLLSRVQGGYNVQVNCDYGVALGEPAGSRIFTAHPSDLGSKSLDFQFTFSAAIFGSGQHLYNALAQFNDVSDGNDSILCSGKIYQIVQVNELEPLEPATPSILGGVKVGENLTIDSDGTLNATVPSLAGYATETYVNTQVSNHATNSTIHVTASDKTNWDDKTTVIWKKW